MCRERSDGRSERPSGTGTVDGDGPARGSARVGELRRSRRAPHVGLRRHLPHQQLDVHLRSGVPGRPDRTGAGARARLLLVRRALHGQGRPPARREDGRAPHARPVAVPEAGEEAGRPDQGQPGRRHRHPAGRRRVHLPQPPRLPRRRRAAPSTGPRSRRASGSWTGSPRSAGSCRCAGSTTPTPTGTSPRPCGSGSAATGARAAQEFHWWCTADPEAFVGHKPVYLEMRDELIELVGRKPYALFVGHVEARTGSKANGTAQRQRLDRHLPPPPGGPPVTLRSPT